MHREAKRYIRVTSPFTRSSTSISFLLISHTNSLNVLFHDLNAGVPTFIFTLHEFEELAVELAIYYVTIRAFLE